MYVFVEWLREVTNSNRSIVHQKIPNLYTLCLLGEDLEYCSYNVSLTRYSSDFALFYRYFHGFCYQELLSPIPSLAPLRRRMHPSAVQRQRARISQFCSSFTPIVSTLRNQLSSDIFLFSNVQTFQLLIWFDCWDEIIWITEELKETWFITSDRKLTAYA